MIDVGAGASHEQNELKQGACGAGCLFLHCYRAEGGSLGAGLVIGVGRPATRVGSPRTILVRGVTI